MGPVCVMGQVIGQDSIIAVVAQRPLRHDTFHVSSVLCS